MRLLTSFLLLCLLMACKSDDDDVLTIAVASNVQFAIAPIIKDFEITYGVKCQSIVGSSGKLVAQIREGAPYDVFMSADMKYPMALFQDSLTLSAPVAYGLGDLVLWSRSYYPGSSLEILRSPSVRHIAIANPDVAPYGRIAVQALQQEGIYEEIKDKLVYGESVAQAAQFALSGAADVCLISKSLVLSPEFDKFGSWMSVDVRALYDDSIQAAVGIVRDPAKADIAQQFVLHLKTPRIQTILQDYGYRPIGVKQ